MPRRASRSVRVPRLRARIWAETDGVVAINEAGADLLDQISATGSLSEAARRLGFGYRRAWLLVDAMNRRWSGPLVSTATGGRRGGGSRLTELGQRVLRAFRDIQLETEAVLDRENSAFVRATRGD